MKIAVIGATGAVGREMVQDLEALVPGDYTLELYASPRSAGETIAFRDKHLTVQPFQLERMRGVDFVLMSAGGAFSKENAHKIAELGPIVIDNSSAWRTDPNCLLIVPEVNGRELTDMLAKGQRPRIIANPNCSTIQMVVALKPLADEYGLDMVQVASYQSVSGSGQKGIRELGKQVECSLKFQELTPEYYAQPIAFNVLPAIDVFDDAGHCFEETKVIRETKRLLGIPDLFVMATTARVPTFHCHAEAVTVKLKHPVKRGQVMSTLGQGEGIVLSKEDDHKTYATNGTATGRHEVFVSRVRLPQGATESPWVQMWVVADNLKKGAATNAVQILNLLRAHKA